MKRIEFVRKTGAAALLLSMGVLLESCGDDMEDMMQDVTSQDGKNDDDMLISFNLAENPFDVLKNVDSWLLHPKENVLLVNVDGVIRAFTSVCTHSGCSDNWEYGNSTFTCNCHGSKFSNGGEVTSGPATSNLQEFDVDVQNERVNITIS